MANRTQLRRFNKFAEMFLNFEKEYNDLSEGSHTMFTIDLHKEEFKGLWTKVKDAYEKLTLDHDLSEEEEKGSSDLFRQCRQAYITCAAQMGALSQTFTNQSLFTSTVLGPSQGQQHLREDRFSEPRLRLPPCTTEIFRGDYIAWPSFRDMFKAVYIDCMSISPVEKLFYLRQTTQGEALEIVKKSPLTNEGFETAWANLRDRYENKRVLVNSQLKILFNLSPVKSEAALEIKRLQREINNVMNALRSHNIDIGSWDPIFVFLCSTKLPVDTLSLWEHSVKDKTEISKWSDLDDFLTARFQSLETVFDLTRVTNVEDVAQNPRFARKVKAYSGKVNKITCHVCSQDHYLKTCSKFLEMSPADRFLAVKRCNLCINCFSPNHRLNQCMNRLSCSKCGSKHNTLLHRQSDSQISSHVGEDSSNRPSTSQEMGQNTEGGGQHIQNCFVTTRRQVLLGTALVNVEANGVIYTARALIDSGSQATIISEKLRNRIGLPANKINAFITGLNNSVSGSAQMQCKFTLGSPIDRTVQLEVSALVLPHLTGKIPSYTVDLPNRTAIDGLHLADPYFAKSDNVDILLGGDIYPQILLDGVRRDVLGSLVAQSTIFGWVLTGPLVEGGDCQSTIFTTCVSFCTSVNLDKQLEKFWNLEEPPMASRVTAEDEYCEDYYVRTTKRLPNGRYVVSLPFKPYSNHGQVLGVSKWKACRQFFRNETSLLKRPALKKIYDEVLGEYALLGHMVEVKQQSDSDTSFYLPHHAVFKPQSTSTKVRVVFNASCPSSSGLSLNDVLYPGPVLQNDLMLLITRWRFYRYVFNGDIEKMYRQIYVEDGDTCFQRIVFRENSHADLREFELKTVTFGVNCAPFLAIRTLLQLASDVEKELPYAARILREMMYVDDALAGAHEIDVAVKARDQLIRALSSAGFSMRKWTANDDKILDGLPAAHLLNEKFLEIEDESKAKTLGVRWNAKGDYFYFAVKPIEIKTAFTKREVLSIIASLFDPAGWLGPTIVIAKILMQQIWSEKTGWDDNLSEISHKQWSLFIHNYNFLNNIQLPRWIGFETNSFCEVHGFADASEKAYGACVYVRIKSRDGGIQTHLLLAKSRVAPLRTITLPRLELCGAVLLADLMSAVKTDLRLEKKKTRLFCWSDSEIVLAWLQKPSSSWATFVGNRVAKITRNIAKENWRHVRSEDNPADIISRGATPQELYENVLWWHGPIWLRSDDEWWRGSSKNYHTEEEGRKVQVNFAYIKDFDDILDRFSCYSRALRIMAYVYRFINATKGRKKAHAEVRISSTELQGV
ncbi:uncharacterized protein LOC142225231 [Haematobia irritans]|uniref:uncharacterized protein LOC142225231 n=1 Tax=Haematobia irritans TaxID=7368 RepID=UPI003F500F35